MTANFAFDRGRGERRERRAPARVEPIRGLDQGNSAHLDQVVGRLAPTVVATRDRPNQRKVRLDQARA
jgi:hypothetical protein